MEKKDTRSIVLIIILFILVLGLSGFIVYDKILSNNETEKTNVANNNTDTIKEEKEELEKLEENIIN